MAITIRISARRWIGLSLLAMFALGLLALPAGLSSGQCRPNECWYCTEGLYTAKYCWPIIGDQTGWCFCEEGYKYPVGFYCKVSGEFCGAIWVP